MKSSTNKILIIDDEPGIREFLAAVATNFGFEVRATGDACGFYDAIESFEPTVLLLDLNMPELDGIEVLRFLSNEQYTGHILLISGESTRVLAAAERLGVQQGLQMAGTLQKPLLIPDLEDALRLVMRQSFTADDLRRAIEQGDLRVHYQPKLAVSGNGGWSIYGAEALVRWQHAEHGIVMPNDFIPLAEETDLIASLTDVVLRAVLQQVGAWKQNGLPLNIAVNIAPKLLTDVEFPDRLASMLKQYGANRSSLTLEITESAAMANQEVAMDILTRLRIKGIALAIDDFGTGYSSMRQLFQLPFSELKIDRSFVMDMGASSEAQTMVNTMIQLAHNLEMTVCAEGVETQEALDYLEAAGCDKVQGFFVSRPLPAPEFERFARDWMKTESPDPVAEEASECLSAKS